MKISRLNALVKIRHHGHRACESSVTPLSAPFPLRSAPTVKFRISRTNGGQINYAIKMRSDKNLFNKFRPMLSLRIIINQQKLSPLSPQTVDISFRLIGD